MSLRAEKLVYPGKCIAYDEEGRTVFIDGVLPGEEVEIGAWRRRKGVVEARADRIITPAKERIVPRCPSFGVCGGCSFQHVGYADQLRLKLGYTQEILDKAGVRLEGIISSPQEWNYRNKVELSFGTLENNALSLSSSQNPSVGGVPPTAPLKIPRPSVTPFKKEGGGAKIPIILGFHKKGRFDEYVSVPPCFIMDEDFLPIIETIEVFARESGLEVFDPNTGRGFWRHVILRKGKRTGDLMAVLVTTPLSKEGTAFWTPLVRELERVKVNSVYGVINTKRSDAVIPETLHHLSGKATIEEHLEVKGETFRFALSPFSFFQTNTLGAEKLYEKVLEYLDPQGDERVLDLFCGTGSIGLCVAPLVRSVHGVEIVEEAIEQARKNAEINGVSNATFEAVAAEKWIKQRSAISDSTFAKASADRQRSEKFPLARDGTANRQSSIVNHQLSIYDAIIVDPPRGGLHPKVARYLKESGARKIIYVSCNPTTLARDLDILTGEERYRIERAIAVDMFPQTYHVEVVVRLTKSS